MDVLVVGVNFFYQSLEEEDVDVAEPSNLMPHRSARLPLDTEHSRKNTKLLGSVRHTLGENPKIHIFAIRITNENKSYIILNHSLHHL